MFADFRRCSQILADFALSDTAPVVFRGVRLLAPLTVCSARQLDPNSDSCRVVRVAKREDALSASEQLSASRCSSARGAGRRGARARLLVSDTVQLHNINAAYTSISIGS
jgi:hypothetical protein